MSQWTSGDRDAELRHIRKVSTWVVAGSLGATVVLGAGIAWGDQQRIDQAAARDAKPILPPGAENPAPSAPALQPPAETPAAPQAPAQPAQPAHPAPAKKPTSHSGGS